jgi:AcrR family transcriptional regulator
VTANEPGLTSRKAQRWEQHKEKTRRDLVASARRLFAERGFEATSAADIAADAGVTERTLFRYFPSKAALVLHEVFALLPQMFQAITDRPAGEPPYQAVCEGIAEFGVRHRDLLLLLIAPLSGEPAVPADERQRALIDFEDTLTEVLRERYELPPGDLVTAGVWARASIGALRTALAAAAQNPPAGESTGTPVIDMVRACFAALPGGLDGEPGRGRRER